MTPTEIADEIARVLDFPANRKHIAVAIDRTVLEEAVNALRMSAYRQSKDGRAALRIAGADTE